MTNIESHIKKLKAECENLLKSSFMSFEELKKLKNVTGVYLIYFNGSIVYIGSTNKFDIRAKDLLYKSTHTLHKKLLEEKILNKKLESFLRINVNIK